MITLLNTYFRSVMCDSIDKPRRIQKGVECVFTASVVPFVSARSISFIRCNNICYNEAASDIDIARVVEHLKEKIHRQATALNVVYFIGHLSCRTDNTSRISNTDIFVRLV